MRYRITGDGIVDRTHPTLDLVTGPVWVALVIGVALVVLGTRGRQRWLVFWGVVTIACCLGYLLRDWLGIPGLG